MWYHRKIGGGRCPIVDTWWQTETGGIMMSPLPGAIAHQARQLHASRCRASCPAIVDSTTASPVHAGQRRLAGDRPSPGPACCAASGATTSATSEQYWSKVPHCYLAGDNARRDEDGYYWIMGRIDDVLNVAGHRLSTIEIESALVSHPRGGRGGRGRPARTN